jgi:hypothetical protein
MIILNQDKETRKLEKKAYKVNKKETQFVQDLYYGDFNDMTGDINIFYYEYMLRNIIKTGKHNEES